MTDQTHCRDHIPLAFVRQCIDMLPKDALQEFGHDHFVTGMYEALKCAMNTRAQASSTKGVTIVEGKDAVRAMSSFIQTGTVVPDGDIGSVRMYVDRALVGSTVYLYDHAFTRSNAKAGEVDSLPDKWRRWAENMRGKVAANRILDCANELEKALSTDDKTKA